MNFNSFEFLIESIENNKILEGIANSDSYALYNPATSWLPIFRPIELAIAEAKKRSEILYDLSPREFEEFIAEIFSNKGYVVHLTKQTRDGGRDLFCLDHRDSKMKIAVEVKRHQIENKIDFDHVTKFVGSNIVREDVNKLIFVTTSNYTQPAKDFQKKYLVKKLDLEDINAVIKWSEEFTLENFKKSLNKIG